MSPANPFVAGFTGNPPMNLYEGSYRLRATSTLNSVREI